MIILSASQIRAADAHTITNEPIASLDLMERASSNCANAILEKYDAHTPILVLAGTGNNGGDGLAIARLLSEKHYNVQVCLVRFSDQLSDDNAANLERLQSLPDVTITEITRVEQLPEASSTTLIVEALVGTGISRPLDGLLLKVVQWINKQPNDVVSIDLPAGLYADTDASALLDKIVHATYTLSFQVPKLNFLLPDTAACVGKWEVLAIGLDQDFINAQASHYYTTDEPAAKALYRTRSLFAHKGFFGHALIVGGSHGKMGAAVLASRACISSGAGLVSSFVPECGYTIMQASVPEVMVHTSFGVKALTGGIDYSSYDCLGVGPGLGMEEATKDALEQLLQSKPNALVLDADALNLLAKHPKMQKWVPKGSILTPHVKEFDRLFGSHNSSFERLQKQREVAKERGWIIVLKGHNTSITDENGTVFFNTTGNPGLATAGSGDVLTGIITALRAQGYDAIAAARLGVYIHGLAGDLAAAEMGQEALISSSIIDHVGKAFKSLYQ